MDDKTHIIGQDRLELLVFRLEGTQLWAANVFKVREVLSCPALDYLPGTSPNVRGLAQVRGRNLPVIDLGAAIGLPPVHDPATCLVIVTEYHGAVQGFLVNAVDRIIYRTWDDVQPPPSGAGGGGYLSAVTRYDGDAVSVLDFERVLQELEPAGYGAGDTACEEEQAPRILIVDDVAGTDRLSDLLNQVGVATVSRSSGSAALDYLHEVAANTADVTQEIRAIIAGSGSLGDGTDLDTALRADDRLAGLHLLVRTMPDRDVAASELQERFQADELAARVANLLASDNH